MNSITDLNLENYGCIFTEANTLHGRVAQRNRATRGPDGTEGFQYQLPIPFLNGRPKDVKTMTGVSSDDF